MSILLLNCFHWIMRQDSLLSLSNRMAYSLSQKLHIIQKLGKLSKQIAKAVPCILKLYTEKVRLTEAVFGEGFRDSLFCIL